MKVRQFVAAAAFAAMSISAQAAVYTYTGNPDTSQSTWPPPRINAWFDISFTNTAPGQTYRIDDWFIADGSGSYDAANGSHLFADFVFDSARNITDWYFGASWSAPNIQSSADYQAESVYSKSANHVTVSSYPGALDSADYSAWFFYRTTLWVENNPGTWAVTGAEPVAEVPEPASLALLGMGAAALGFLRRRQRPTA